MEKAAAELKRQMEEAKKAQEERLRKIAIQKEIRKKKRMMRRMKMKSSGKKVRRRKT